EEVVASLQGIICRADLPPFRERINGGSRQMKYVRQSVTLTGLGSPAFDAVSVNVAEVHTLFGRIVGADRLQECSIYTTFEGGAAVEMSNRYFTPSKEAESGAARILSEEIDPLGILTQAAGTEYIHTEDNEVCYYERQGKNEDNYKFVPIPPVTFQIGDIVEVQVSFAIFPLREGKLKTSMILRSISLLDGSQTKAASVLKISSKMKGPAEARVTLKRRVGYYEEEVSATRAKLSHMRIEEKDSEEEAERLMRPEGSKTTGLDNVD
ncbi:hypothetical protein GALMADRAFT_62586, partial [Galerina marginata CBS 339.88]